MRLEGDKAWMTPDEANFVKQVCALEDGNTQAKELAVRTQAAIFDWAKGVAGEIVLPDGRNVSCSYPHVVLFARMETIDNTEEAIGVTYTASEREIVKALAAHQVALLLDKAGIFGPVYDDLIAVNSIASAANNDALPTTDQFETMKAAIFEADLKLIANGQSAVAGL